MTLCSPEKLQRFCDLRASGVLLKDIARELRVSASTLDYWVQRYNLPRSKRINNVISANTVHVVRCAIPTRHFNFLQVLCEHRGVAIEAYIAGLIERDLGGA